MPDLTLPEALAQTQAMLRQTLTLARTRQRARKAKPTEQEKQAIKALVTFLWNSHTEAASIAYGLEKRR